MEEKNDNKEENFIKDGVIEIDPDIGLKPDIGLILDKAPANKSNKVKAQSASWTILKPSPKKNR